MNIARWWSCFDLSPIAVHRLCIAILPALVAFAACSRQAPHEQPVDLTQLYRASDQAAFTQYIQSDHAVVRRQLDSLLVDFLAARARDDSTTGDSLLSELTWLCAKYETASGVSDKARRLQFYRNLSQIQSRRKITLDSTYSALDSLYRLQGKAAGKFRKDDYLRSLNALFAEYEAIDDSFYLASVDFNTAKAYYDRGDIDSTVMVLSRSKSICRQIDYLQLAGDCELLFAKVYNVCQADYFQAEKALLRAVENFKKVGLRSRIAYARTYQAYDFFLLYQTDRAIDGFHRARDVFIREGNRRMQAYCTYMLAEAHYDKANLDSAGYFAQQSLALRREIAEEDSHFLSDVGYSISCMGLIAQAQSDYTKAKESYLSADEIFQRAGDEHGLCTNYMRLASLLVSQRNYSESYELYRLVLETSTRFEDNILALYGLALCNYYTGRTQTAIANLQRCVRRLEMARQKLPIPEIKTGMLSDKIGFYHLLASIFVERYEQLRDTTLLDSAFQYLERSKSQVLIETLLSDRPTEQRVRENSLIEQISSLENALILGVGDSAALITERLRLEDSLHTLRVAETRHQSDLPSILTAKIPSLQQMRRRLLKKNDILLEYLISDFGSYVFVVTTEEVGIEIIELDRTRLERMIASYVQAINKYPTSNSGSQDWKEIGKLLYLALVPEQSRNRPDKDHLLIVGTGLLNYLPFGALVDRQGRFLIETYDISYTPSITTMHLLKTKRRLSQSSKYVIAFGDPSFEEAGFDPLPHSREEVESLVDILGSDKVRLYLGSQATKDNFVGVNYVDTRYLHLATHGVSNDFRPERSALLFATSGTHDVSGLLLAPEIARLTIPVELVFLSACRSGTGPSFPGEGVLSLVQPFLAAGSNSVIVSYWNIDDRCSVDLVRRFYSHLGEGHSKARSLALAKRHVLRAGRELYQHPYFWAPYVLIGLWN